MHFHISCCYGARLCSKCFLDINSFHPQSYRMREVIQLSLSYRDGNIPRVPRLQPNSGHISKKCFPTFIHNFRVHIQNDNTVQLSGINWRGLSIWNYLYGALEEKKSMTFSIHSVNKNNKMQTYRDDSKYKFIYNF